MIEDMRAFSRMAEEAGINAIDVSVGMPEGRALKYEVPPIDLPVGFNVHNATKIKEVVNIPVVAVGRINDPIIAEKILDEGKADFIAIGRGQLGDPEFCKKAMKGNFDKIVKCIACDQGCIDKFMLSNESISCLRNPACGKEKEFELIPTEEKKKVLVIGGGPAGLEAATTLKRRGHDVILCEKSSSLGGQFYLAGAAPRKQEMSEAAIQMGEIAKDAGVDIRLQTKVTTEVIAKIKPDEVVLAVGSNPFIPNISGVNKEHVMTAHEVLSGIKTTKDKVGVIGGGLVGLEVAELLAEQGKEVTVIEMLDEVGKDLGILRKICVMENIYRDGIKMITSTRCLEIKDNSILIEKDEKQDELKNINSVVIAVGAKAKPVDDLKYYLDTNNIVYHVIGDAKKARRAIDAIWEGAKVGREI